MNKTKPKNGHLFIELKVCCNVQSFPVKFLICVIKGGNKNNKKLFSLRSLY